MLLAELGGTNTGRLTRVNTALCRITGYSRRQLLTMSLSDLTHPAHLAAHRRRLAEVTSGRRAHGAVQRRWIRADGREIWVQFNVSTVGTRGDQRHLVGMVDDITDRVLREQGLRDRMWHDPLTGLPTRELFTDRLAHALRAVRRTGTAVALLQIEMDDLDLCRDDLGPGAGDELVVAAGRRLVANVRPGDTVARSGPAHFLVLCPAFAPSAVPDTAVDADLGHLVERVRDVLAAPYRLGGIVHHVPVRIGGTTSPPGQEADHLLDVLERSVPTGSPGRIPTPRLEESHCTPALLGRAAAERYVGLENELRRALRDDELVMYGQPIVTVASGCFDAVEMLLRWRHPERGLLGPADFLDVAEAGPLMGPLGRRVLQESCRIAAGWQVPPGAALSAVFVNVSGRQLESGRLPAEVSAALAESGLAADRLVLELTETCAPMISGAVLADLATLRERGIRLAIDDVGTGYSSLARLTELPIDLLKIDRTFIIGMGTQDSADAVIRAIMGISRSLGVPVVAEGIETVDQADAVAGHGCDAAQGFFFSRPCPEDQLAARLRQPGRPRVPS